MKTIEELVSDLTKRLILVQNIQQLSPTRWQVTLSSVADWYYRQGEGSSLFEALDNARTEALRPKPVWVAPKLVQARVRLKGPNRKRVKLTGRVRLK